MKFQKIRLVGAVALAASLACGRAVAAFLKSRSPSWSRTAAGGANDAMARVIGQAMSAILKQPVIVDKAGANGAASEYVMRA